jgi:hypothetical protein
MAKNVYFISMFIFYHRAIVKQDHYIAYLLSYANTILLCSRCKIRRYITALFAELAVGIYVQDTG